MKLFIFEQFEAAFEALLYFGKMNITYKGEIIYLYRDCTRHKGWTVTTLYPTLERLSEGYSIQRGNRMYGSGWVRCTVKNPHDDNGESDFWTNWICRIKEDFSIDWNESKIAWEE